MIATRPMNQRLARLPTDDWVAQRTLSTFGDCGCNSLWLPPNLNLPSCATCPDGAPNRFQFTASDYWSDLAFDEEPFTGVQTLTADPNSACIWRSEPVEYGDPPSGQTVPLQVGWLLDLSNSLGATLTLDVVTPGFAGYFGTIIYDLAAPRFGCSCPTPFRRRCVREKFPLQGTRCMICVEPPAQHCGDILIPETLTCSTGSSNAPAAQGWNFALNFDPNAYWGPIWGHARGWIGSMQTINGVDVTVVIDPCRAQQTSGVPNGVIHMENGPCIYSNPGGPFIPPYTQTEVWTNLYSRPSFNVHALSPLEIGLRGERSDCNDNLEDRGDANRCNLFSYYQCGSSSFGGTVISLGAITIDLTVTE